MPIVVEELGDLVEEPAPEPQWAGRATQADFCTLHGPGDPEEATPGPQRGRQRPSLADLRTLNVPGADEVCVQSARGLGPDAHSDSHLRSGASCLEILVRNTVLVAVRIRPFSLRETSQGSGGCVRFEGPTGIALQREEEKDALFSFDCVMRQDVSQRDAFDRTGRPLLHKVLEGYNGCLFAYGQTGSGKTWTMQGETSGPNRGIIPLMCQELFQEIGASGSTKKFSVSCGALEIYNERVKDLFGDGADLQLREDPGRGVYVEGLTESLAASSEDVLGVIEKGQARRAVGKTNMNEHSSRSHAVVSLTITSNDTCDTIGETQTVSKLNLIDLAGSERQKSTGAFGDRLKEGAQINKSLSALGNVINALTDVKGGRRHVPYRDSKLTRLLQDSLGGNSYTVMICNCSPARVNVEETLSSLRFAERAKKIENKARVNRDPASEKFMELAEENKVLRAKVARLEAHICRLEEHYEA